MTQGMPAPVLDFFARFLANPHSRTLPGFCTELVGLEFRRVLRSVLTAKPLFRPGDDYLADIDRADRVLKALRQTPQPRHEDLDLPYLWLTLLGHRLATERGFPVGGLDALARVASARLNLPLKETEIWSEDRVFETFTKTELRDEWDYAGLQFRMGAQPDRFDRV